MAAKTWQPTAVRTFFGITVWRSLAYFWNDAALLELIQASGLDIRPEENP